ncbi:MAG: MFS transporter [Bryobacteraceae bacterium]
MNLLRRNANYRRLWLAQVVSEAGDYFNNVAVFSLAMQTTGSGLVVSGIMLARAIPAVLTGPLAGVVLDRFDRRRIMIASDVVRSVVAFAFMACLYYRAAWLLYALSALLMAASPFFTSGRAALLPSIASGEELRTANSLTQTTQWATLTAGTMLGGLVTARMGFSWAFAINALSFVYSAAAVAWIRPKGARAGEAESAPATSALQPWRDYKAGLDYMRSVPLVLGIGLLTVGWAMGGGAAQILFALFGEQVFQRGAEGIGTIWGFAGVGLLAGGALAHLAGGRLDFAGYKRAIALCYLVHGAAYVVFSRSTWYPAALFWILLSRVGMAVTSVLNNYQLLRTTPDRYLGRVFATLESLRWFTMMFSMAAAGLASEYFNPRAIGVVAGLLGCLTAVGWALADVTGRLPEPQVRKPDLSGC